MQTETTAPAPVADPVDSAEVTLPTPDLSVLTEQPPAVEQTKDDKAPSQELTETTPASVGLVVALVVVSIVAAVVVAMWMVSPLMALLLGAGLIVAAVLGGAGWLAWRRFTRRTKGGRDRTSGKPTGKSDGGKAGGWWPFSRTKNGGKTPAGGGKPTGSGGGKPNGGGKAGGGWWPFGRTKNGGKTPDGGGKTNGGGGGKAPKGGKPNGGGKADGGKAGWWPFGRNKNGGKTPAGGGNGGGGKAPKGGQPTGGKTPNGGKPNGGGGKSNGEARRAKPSALPLLLQLARAARKTRDRKAAADKPAGKDDHAAKTTRPAPGGHRPETVIDVDLADITSPAGRPGPSSTGRATSAPRTSPGTAPRTAPPPFDPGPTAGSGRWEHRSAPMPLRNTPHDQHQAPVSQHLGGPQMSTSTTTSTVDQDAMRVANRYAGLIEKAQTLTDRARACRDAADQYRSDARANQESAENHKMAARTIRDVNVAHEHAVAAREAEAEAAREILAARFYEAQAEEYEAQARSIGF